MQVDKGAPEQVLGVDLPLVPICPYHDRPSQILPRILFCHKPRREKAQADDHSMQIKNARTVDREPSMVRASAEARNHSVI